MLSALSTACASYCTAGGVLAALIKDSRTQRLYGDVFVSIKDLSVFCDSAESQAEADGWGNVPYFLGLMEEAAVEIESKIHAARDLP